ncbi:hypothetical protein TL16_g02784 [Triparma laevis f. inornata]|uniref:Major facilitator superfamily associated domain-containing protein n=2 Tax=Triparma laevis TaxID=1534972 RepID=A0A9W6ZUU7_9STRA|nr:hypothetical protein TrLO_g10734 [Triparma laevis f. longispina]GMH59232.1 hypothetical protein TL16_g02784 [Triparma laevis f. inornata]
MKASPSLLYFTSFMLFASNGGRFSSLIFPALCPAFQSSPLLLSLFFILANISSATTLPKIVSIYAQSSASRKANIFTVAVLVTTFTYFLAFLPPFSSAPIQIVLRMFGSISTSLISTLGDSLTVKHGQKHGSEFGQARLYGAVSWALMSIFVGILAESTGSWAAATLPAATISALLAAHTGKNLILNTEDDNDTVAYAKVDESENDPPPQTQTQTQTQTPPNQPTPLQAFQKFTATFTSSSFIFSVFALATGMSIVESLSFEYFANSLHAPPSLNGLTVLITVIFEIPLFHYASALENRIGYKNMQLVAMLAYSLRVIGYTLVPQAWMILLLEPLHGVTYALGKTASISFVKIHCDGAVGQSVVNVIRGNIGPLLGLFVYGLFAELWSEDAAYRGFGIFVFAACIASKAMSTMVHEKTNTNTIELEL